MDDSESILIVDDNERLLDAIRRILESEGYSVLTAADGIAALQIMQTTPPNLVIADITMPHMNGYQLHERVRQNPDWMMIPFIFLTGRAMNSDIRYGKEIGVDDYLVKPIEPEDLIVAVRGKLKRAQQGSRHWSRPSSRHAPQQHGPSAAAGASLPDVLVVGGCSSILRDVAWK